MSNQLLKTPKLLKADEGEVKHFFGIEVIQKVSQVDTNGGWVMNEMIITLGNGAPLHTHPWNETFYVLEGELEVQVGPQKAVATSGMLMFVPENVAHSFRAASPNARVLEMIPASAEKFYREGAEQIPTVPPDPEIFQALCQKYNVQFF